MTDQFEALREGIGARELCVREESMAEVVQLVEGPEEVPVVREPLMELVEELPMEV